jgi:hypothetical protein
MHGSHFTGGTTGNVQKGEKFVRAAAFEAFCDVIRDGERGALHLVTQTGMATEGVVICEGVGSPG